MHRCAQAMQAKREGKSSKTKVDNCLEQMPKVKPTTAKTNSNEGNGMTED